MKIRWSGTKFGTYANLPCIYTWVEGNKNLGSTLVYREFIQISPAAAAAAAAAITAMNP